jgi:predicted permease
MFPLRQIFFRLQPFFRRRKIEAELSEEMRAHLEMATEANIAAGMSSEEARYAARREFGGVDQVKESYRDERGLRWLEDLGRDLRYAARSLRKNAGFSLAVVAMLAIGIGVTTAFATLALRVLWPKLPYPHPEQLVMLDEIRPGNRVIVGFRTPRLAFYRSHAVSFAGLATELLPHGVNLVVNGETFGISAGEVTADFFNVLGLQPELGRVFLPTEFANSTGDVVVLTHRVWLERFNSDPGIVGRDLQIGERIRRVVGVMPEGLRLPAGFGGDVIVPMDLKAEWPPVQPIPWGQLFVIGAFGRLKPGVTRAQAQAELEVLAKANSAWMHYAPGETTRISSLTSDRFPSAKSQIFGVFLGAVFLLYAIAVSNVANLILVRSLLRRREIAVRMALGGSRGRIARLIVTETLLLAAVGGAVGVFVAHWCWSISPQLLPWESLGWVDLTHHWIDVPTICLAAVMSTVTCVLVTLIPVWRVTRASVNETLKEGSGSLGDSRRLGGLRSGFVVVQAALAVVLLLGAGLMMQTSVRLEKAGVGFEPANLSHIEAGLPKGLSAEVCWDDTARFAEKLARIPGVRRVALADSDPLLSAGGGSVTIEGRPERGEIKCFFSAISADYFSTIGIPMRAGRGFVSWKAGDPPVVVINETLAQRCFGTDDPIGKRLVDDEKKPMEVVGVVGDVRNWEPQADAPSRCYLPVRQAPDSASYLGVVLQLSGSPGPKFEETVRRAAFAIDPRIVVKRTTKLEDEVYERVALERNAVVLFRAVSALATILAAVGLFALMAYAVAQRHREFGLRMALGATPENLQWLVLRRGLRLAALGVLLGLGAAWGLTRFLQSLLFETSPHDPLTYGAVAVGLLGVAALACWLPARRAAKVDPMEALRAE